jgi:hypothetical protein
VLIEIEESGTDSVKFSGKCEQDMDRMVRELGVQATPALLYCHTCENTFKTREDLDRHKEQTGHT